MNETDEHNPDEIAKGTSEYFNYLEEADSTECIYTWEALMQGSILLYDFKESA
jgi:hypothetical protein